MTIKLLTPRDLTIGGRTVTYPAGALVTLDAATETGLIDSKEATATLTDGITYTPPVPSGQPVPLTVIPSAQGVEISGDGLDWLRAGYDQIFILGGQSNVDGRGSLAGAEAPHPTALLYDKQERIRLLEEPAGKTGPGWINNIPAGVAADASTAAAHSIATSLGKMLVQYGVRPLLVPCGIGSTDLATHWLPPAVEDDRTTLFGALTYRTKMALRPGITPVFVWVGHEGNATSTDWNLSTGAPGRAYADRWAQHIYELRKRFPGCIVVYAQLGAYFTSAATLTKQVIAADQQRRLEADYLSSTFVSGTYGESIALQSADITISNTDATNTVTDVGGGAYRIASDGGKAVGFQWLSVKKGLTYRISLTVAAGLTGSIKMIVNASETFWNSAGGKAVVITPTADTRIWILRDIACDVTISNVSLEHDAYNQAKMGCYMAVSHDIPRNTAPDDIHYSTAGVKVLGRRIARAYAERALGVSVPNESGNATTLVSGTGPRLVSITKPSSTTVKVKFSKTIQASATGYGAALATSLFRVYDAGTEKTLSDCVRDPADDTAVLITLAAAATGTVVVTYGDRTPPSGVEQWRPGVVYDLDGLPAPMFMQAAT